MFNIKTKRKAALSLELGNCSLIHAIRLSHGPMSTTILDMSSFTQLTAGFKATPSISALSTELLFLIFENLYTPDLLAISRTSQRLYYLALPIYLSRHGISESNTASRRLVLENGAMRALPGLQMSISITSLDYLSCKFNVGHANFAWEVNHLVHFVLGLREVKEVSLHLGNIDSRWISGLVVANSNSWKPEFLRLLMVLLKKGCAMLTLAHGRFLTSDSLATVPPTAHQPAGLFRGSLSAVTHFLNSSISSPSTEVKLDDSNSIELRGLSIHSDLLFIYPFHEWFIQTLNSSPIDTLSLHLSGIPQKIWSRTLSSIAIPSLSHFSAETIDIGFIDLLKFLFRHPKIHSLNLHSHFMYTGPRKLTGHLKKLRLPYLTFLSGNPQNVRELIGILRPLPLSCSISLSIPLHQRTFHAIDFEDLGRKVGMAVEGITPVELSLKFLVPYSVDDASSGKEPKYNGASPFVDVQTLKFATDGQFAFEKWIRPELPIWLGTAFPALQHVSFSDDCAPLDPVNRVALVQAIKQASASVRLVSMVDEDYTLAPRSCIHDGVFGQV